jgi:hypothetical protein
MVYINTKINSTKDIQRYPIIKYLYLFILSNAYSTINLSILGYKKIKKIADKSAFKILKKSVM